METLKEQGRRQAPRRPVRAAFFLLPLLCCGCFGVTQNPSYFPYLLPTGDIIQTHAKPLGSGYYGNFDPNAIRLEVRPLDATNPVRTQHVIVATVYDAKGRPRRDRRIEWMLEGVGHIIQVDESGFFPGRGYKVNDKYAVSYTNYCEHRITRGTAGPGDDFVVRPGQSWCVVSSPVEGDTHVTVYAPGIYDWQKNAVVVTARWVDAAWRFPGQVVARAGSEAVLTTQVFRHTEQRPLAGYRVRYRVLDGPQSLFLPERGPESVAVSDLSGNASARLVQLTPQAGLNRVGIEVIRAPDPTAPSGSAIVLARGETTVEWVGPVVALAHIGPETAGLGAEVPYTITIANGGKVESRAMTVTDPVPEGLQYVRSSPPAVLDNGRLVWTLGTLPPGQTHTVQATFKSMRLGAVTNCAAVLTEEGLKDEKCVTTQVTQPGLKVSVTGPPMGVLGQPAAFRVTVSNPGGSPATNVTLSANFGEGLEYEELHRSLNLKLGELKPLEQRDLPPLTLTPRKAGRLSVRVEAKADGGLGDQAEHSLQVQQAQLKVSVAGPKSRYVGLRAEWEVRVSNPGEVPLTGVTLRDQLPPEVRFESSTEGGRPGNNEVVWDLGTLKPGEEKSVRVAATCERPAAAAVNRATATADPGQTANGEAAVEILGVPAFAIDVKDVGDPVEVGKRVTYRIAVTNTGSVPAGQVEIKATLPPELQLVAGGARGPSAPSVAGQVITFAKVDNVAPQQTLEYTVEAQGLRPGDVRFRVELRAQSLREPVLREESTRVFQPAPGPGAAAPPPQGTATVPTVSVGRVPTRLPAGPAAAR